MSDEGCGCAVLMVILGAIVALAQFIGGAFLAIIAAGVLWGCVKAIINIGKSLVASIDEYKNGGSFKNKTLEEDAKKNHPDGDYSEYDFETVGRKSVYFIGGSFPFALRVVRNAFKINRKSIPDKSRIPLEGFSKFIGSIWWGCQVVSIKLLGPVFVAVLGAALIIVFTAVAIIMAPIMGIVLFFNWMYFKKNGISNVCPVCKKPVDVYYRCPKCNASHIALSPSSYGINHRVCLCGTKLPTKPKQVIKNKLVAADGTVTFEEISLDSMSRFCIECDKEIAGGLSRPISVAFVGGASVGKTTFMTAFAHDFIETETITNGFDYDFADTATEMKYETFKKSYRGTVIEATNRGVDGDIIPFSFSLSHPQLPAPRSITLYDMAGEVFLSGQAKEGWAMHEFSDGAVFLIDPYGLSGVAQENDSEISGNSMGVCNSSMDELVDALIDTLRSVNSKRIGKKFALPIALTINKVDTALLKKQTGDDAVDYFMNTYPADFDDRGLTVDFVCRSFLMKREGEGFIRKLDNNFENVHFFYSSPMGYVPKAKLVRYRPINVMPVMHWLFSRADKQIGKLWSTDCAMRDLNFTEKEFYLDETYRRLYDDYYDSL